MNVKNQRKKVVSRRKTRKGGSRLTSMASRAVRPLLAKPLLAKAAAPVFGQMAFSTRPPPLNRRFTLKNFKNMNTGTQLKKGLSNNVLHQLELLKRQPVAVVKSKVFEHYRTLDKIRGLPGQIEIAAVRYAIEAKEAAKGKADEIAALKEKEAELVAKYGENSSVGRGNFEAKSNFGHVNAAEEQEMRDISSRATEVSSRVLKNEKAVSRGKEEVESMFAEKQASEDLAAGTEDALESISAGASASASGAAIERTMLEAGMTGESRVSGLLPGLEKAESAAGEAAVMYSTFFGKSSPIIPTKEGLGAAQAEAAGFKVNVPKAINAVGLLESVKAFTPYGMALQKLSGNLRLAKKNVEAFRVLAINIADESAAMVKYNSLVDNGLKVILENSTQVQISKLITVFNPQRMIEFKSAMVTLFSHSITDATTVFNIMITNIIPRAKYNEKLIDSLIAQIRIHPEGAVTEFQKLSGMVLAEEVKTLAAAAQAVQKGSGWFRIKSFYTALLGAGGATVLFLANYMNTPDMKSFATAVGDAKNDMMGDLEQNPNYQKMAAVGTSLRDGILVKVLQQIPESAAEPVLVAKPTWYGFFMKRLGYNPEKSEDRRKFAELGPQAAAIGKDVLVKGLIAGVSVVVVGAIKAALGR
jgi:hypothetical protein